MFERYLSLWVAVCMVLVAGDLRFLVLATPAEGGSYNCAGDDQLARRFEAGARGAFWDILCPGQTR